MPSNTRRKPLDVLTDQLDWPVRHHIVKPSGVGASVYARLAETKIGRVLRDRFPGTDLATGILTRNPSAAGSEPPIALVCEFARTATDKVLREVRRLAWNFCRAPILVTVEPALLRSWSCCEPPQEGDGPLPLREDEHLDKFEITSNRPVVQQLLPELHWLNLATGEYFRKPERVQRLSRDGQADNTLLENLRTIRRALLDQRPGAVSADEWRRICHQLLARIIFVQFLCDRCDSDGQAALSEAKLDEFRRRRHRGQPVLRGKYTRLHEILRDHGDTYSLFRYLDACFNGDLFPGKDPGPRNRIAVEQAWADELRTVTPAHLELLARLISGEEEAATGQRLMWKHYAFDTIPLEFISSIYEEFLTEDREENPAASRQRKGGAYYTPVHLVDFILDEVLPWSGAQWNLRILDPACGSGIFLVKAFQRLAHRWRSQNYDKTLPPSIARRLLEKNILGVDNDHEAIRVASFSLYLAMLDELDPRDYWHRNRKKLLPPLRDSRLIHSDFFSENNPSFATGTKQKFDLVIGNAPWGDKVSIGPEARAWEKAHHWQIPDKNLGPLFLPKAWALLKKDGQVALLQPAMALLFNRSKKATAFRQRLFRELPVARVVNFAPLVRFLIPKVIVPACLVVLRRGPGSRGTFSYACAKAVGKVEDGLQIIVLPEDEHSVFSADVQDQPALWSALMWGGRLGMDMVRATSETDTLRKLKHRGLLHARVGLNEGGAKQETQEELRGWTLFKETEFPKGSLRYLSKTDPGTRVALTDEDIMVYEGHPVETALFKMPQLLIKLGWRREEKRFQSRIIQSIDDRGVICSQSYLTVRLLGEGAARSDDIWSAFNSAFATAYLFLTSGRFAAERAQPSPQDFLDVPIPRLPVGTPPETLAAIDREVARSLELTPSEAALVADLCTIILPDFKGDASSPGRQPTERESRRDRPEPDLTAYCDFAARGLRSTYGSDKVIGATIFQETGPHWPLRVVAMHLGPDSPTTLPRIERVNSDALRAQLQKLAETLGTGKDWRHALFTHRTARILVEIQLGPRKVPTVFFIKPDQKRYWTRTAALHDADTIVSELWNLASHPRQP